MIFVGRMEVGVAEENGRKVKVLIEELLKCEEPGGITGITIELLGYMQVTYSRELHLLRFSFYS